MLASSVGPDRGARAHGIIVFLLDLHVGEVSWIMKARTLGMTEVTVPIIGQGTWNMERDDRRSAIDALHAGIDAGLTHIDTAEMYGGGGVEKIVGEAIASRRDEVYLVSKVLPYNASRKGTISACEKSLKRLRTNVLDLYLLHWPGSHPLEDTIEAFEQLVEQGKIQAYGVSNFDVEELTDAVRIAGPGKIACNQVVYHLGQRTIEHDVSKWCALHDVSIVAYSPLGSGDFPTPGSAAGQILADIAEKHGATPHQVALAFLVRESHVFAIPKAAQVSHVLDNAGAAKLVLDSDDELGLEKAFPIGPRTRSLPMI